MGCTLGDPQENERISLRLDPEDLELIDEFLAESNEFSNRSQLARAAIRAYIELRGQRLPSKRSNEVLVQLPPLVLDTIRSLVEEGVYLSTEDAVVDSTRRELLHTGHVEDLKRDAHAQRRHTLRVMPKD